MMIETLENNEKAQRFRTERLEKIKKGEVWGSLSEGPYCVLHWLPISTEPLFNTNDFKSMEFSKFVTARVGSRTEVPDIYGIRVHCSSKDQPYKSERLEEDIRRRYYWVYRRPFWNAQLFHFGALEVAFAMSFRIYESSRVKSIFPGDLVDVLRVSMDGFRKFVLFHCKTAPIMVGVSILNVQDYKLPIRDGAFGTCGHSNIEDIVLPEKKIKNLQKLKNIGEIENLIFDELWQSFGIRECEYYDDCGERISTNR